MRSGTFTAVIMASFFAVGVAAWLTGYQMGKATPCTDEESFEIHPMQ